MYTLFHQLGFIGVALYTTAMQLIKMNGLNKKTAPQTKSWQTNTFSETSINHCDLHESRIYCKNVELDYCISFHKETGKWVCVQYCCPAE